MAPEYIVQRLMTPKCDVFSLGVTIFHMMVGEKGYSDYCDLRTRHELPEKGQGFIEGVRKIKLDLFCRFLCLCPCNFIQVYSMRVLFMYAYYRCLTGTRILEKNDAGNRGLYIDRYRPPRSNNVH